MSKFKRGDRVRYVGTYSSELIGAVGTVDKQFEIGDNVDVDWDHGQRPRGVMRQNIEKIKTPAGIKPGDRVVGFGFVSGRKYVGTADYERDNGRWKLKDVDHALSEGGAWTPVVERVTLFEQKKPALDFVGPEPKPAESPRVTTPFKVNPGARRVVLDSLSREVLRVNGDELTATEDVEFAALVVELLNAHFGVK